ncbi:hypothetical protein NA78x_001094 [Anatilimnocola sp. NA78]|uniref:hypothetical protein n=1 Tax=Anatilimnocola sp. NA78 TaxID=3415683 RepID=UPI003CE496D6
MFRQILTCLCGVLLAASAASAASAARADDEPPINNNLPEQIALTLSPAGEPRPALKYSLAIGVRERTAGNGATFYYRALLMRKSLGEAHHKLYAKRQPDWENRPLDDKTRAEIREWLVPNEKLLREVRRAVYCEHCAWDFRLQDLSGMDAISFPMDEIQGIRDLGRVLSLKIRLAIAEQRYDEALETLRWGFQLCIDCAEQPLLISQLVGIAVAGVMAERVSELIAAPDAPNLYWAIAALPRPLITIRRALDFERGFGEQIFPFLKDAETVERTPAEWKRRITGLSEDMKSLSSESPTPTSGQAWLEKAGQVLMLAKIYPTAKEELIAQGMDAKKLEAMPTAQVVAIHISRATRASYDQAFKASLLPFPENLRLAAEIEKQQQASRRSSLFAGFQLAQLLVPAVSSVSRSEMRLPRQLAALQAIEAIRMHAAVTGKLPDSLSEITVVPALPNPITHEPFPYQRKGAEATLVIPILPDEGPKRLERHYTIRLRP